MLLLKRLLLSLSMFACIAFSPQIVQAQDSLPSPTGEVVLTVTGEITHENHDGAAQFDLEMLRKIGVESFETSTIWTEGTARYSGIRLSRLLEAVGAEGAVLRASAINDYAGEIPVTDAVESGPILAFEKDGRLMSVREKGPLWVIYPYDQNVDYQSEIIHSRSIWQLTRIEVLP